MRRLSAVRNRCPLHFEQLEKRLLLDSSKLTVPLDPTLDLYGDQIVTIQAYGDSTRAAYGIFDTGASAVTFSATDQFFFKGRGEPIPIVVPGGAHADGIGGSVTGDVGAAPPGGIMATGLHGAQVTFSAEGPVFTANFGPGTAVTAGIQPFVGTTSGSPNLSTITGMPIMSGGSSQHAGPYAALITMHGTSFDFSHEVPGLTVTMPDLSFVDAGTQLSADPNSTAPVTIPLSFYGSGSNSGGGVTQAPSPVQNNTTVVKGSTQLDNQSFLLDTGAQMTAISPAEAEALGFDLSHPTRYLPIQGVGGSEEMGGFTLDRLDLPLTNGSELEFTNVPVLVLNLGPGLDGLLGMNLWNNAAKMLYDPYGPGGPTLSVSFNSLQQVHHGSNGDDLSELQSLGLPLAGPTQGPRLTSLEFATGDIHGQVFLNYSGSGIQNGSQPGIAGQTLYVDLNGSGQYVTGDPLATTDSNGFYQFSRLNPGTYTVREVLPSTMVMVSPPGGSQTVVVQADAVSDGVNFANMPLQANPTASYVTTLYGSILNRAPDVNGFNYWIQYLQAGGSQTQVSQAFWESLEHRQIQVQQYYQYYLGRPADPVGLNYWGARFLSGASETDIQSAILASGEYQTYHSDSTSFLNGLYGAVLGRAADAAGLAAWTQALANGMARDQVARAFLTSGEAYQRTVDSYYSDYLHRPADLPGQNTWVFLLQTGQKTVNQVAEGFLASGEYFQWAKQFSQ
jgi:hypothetical protein